MLDYSAMSGAYTPNRYFGDQSHDDSAGWPYSSYGTPLPPSPSPTTCESVPGELDSPRVQCSSSPGSFDTSPGSCGSGSGPCATPPASCGSMAGTCSTPVYWQTKDGYGSGLQRTAPGEALPHVNQFLPSAKACSQQQPTSQQNFYMALSVNNCDSLPTQHCPNGLETSSQYGLNHDRLQSYWTPTDQQQTMSNCGNNQQHIPQLTECKVPQNDAGNSHFVHQNNLSYAMMEGMSDGQNQCRLPSFPAPAGCAGPRSGQSGGCVVKTEPSAGDEATCAGTACTQYRPQGNPQEMGHVPDDFTESSRTFDVGLDNGGKKERRREQNRRAARKCRIKKKHIWDGLYKDYAKLEASNVELQRQIDKLLVDKQQLRDVLQIHAKRCSLEVPGL